MGIYGCYFPNCFEWLMGLLALRPLCKNSFLTKIYAACFLLAIALSFCYQMNGRIQTKFVAAIEVNTRTIVVGTINTTVDLLCSIVITLPVLYFDEILAVKVENEMKDLDMILSKYVPDKRQKRSKFSVVNLIILNTFYVVLLLNDVINYWQSNVNSNFQFYIFDQPYRYRITICGLYISDLVKAYSNRIITTNRILKNAFQEVSARKSLEDPNVLSRLEKLIADVSILHSKFPSIVSSFNAVFGWPILLIFLNYIFLFLTTYEMSLRLGTNISGRMYWQYFTWSVFNMTYSMVNFFQLNLLSY